MHPHRLLFIDAYDSFSNSIISLLQTELHIAVESIKIHDARFVLNDEAFFRYLDGFDAVVAGPGPGHPDHPGDVGLIGKLWHLPNEHTIPVMGICLGFQSLCLAYGARIERLKEPRHGIPSVITHCGKDIYAGTGKVVATQYHSLNAKVDGADGENFSMNGSRLTASKCSQLLPLAMDLSNAANGPILMGVRHVDKPLWGVQYHPESICTSSEGQKLIQNWWQEVCAWRFQQNRTTTKMHLPPESNGILQPVERIKSPQQDGRSTHVKMTTTPRTVKWDSLPLDSGVDISVLVELLRRESGQDPFLLESGCRNGKAVNPETGRFSIIGLQEASSLHVRYHSDSQRLLVTRGDETIITQRSTAKETLKTIDSIMAASKVNNGPEKVPFWGGLVGYLSYEAGLETIDVPPSPSKANQPDIWFVLIERSVVVDHVEGVVYIQSLRGDRDQAWVVSLHQIISRRFATERRSAVSGTDIAALGTISSEPQKADYCNKVRACQDLLRAGESYELCLTDQTRVKSSVDPWSLYCHLRNRNPAPFSSYIRLQNAESSLSIVSSSPERFLSWSRQGKCQFRPIKGTVKKGPRVTRETAEAILGSAKERAENLMIVDLIRHDLSGVPGVRNVCVPKLMSMEEYETVYQLVSVIEGDLDASTSGTAALAASLPPGSMTGAPKKRSCELLKEIEGDQPRGLYSGVIGYFDVGGGGDFSVVIRTAFKWDDQDEWRVGAGGAVTALSEATAEWEEMSTKRESVLRTLVD